MNHTDKCIDLLSGRKNESKPLAQIAEMESAEKPLTVKEWLNQASVEQAAKYIIDFSMTSCESWCSGFEPFVQTGERFTSGCDNKCERHMAEYLNSPHTEGETK